MKFDELLTAPAHEAGAEMQVMHPVTGEPTDVFIMLKGVDSKTFRNASIEHARKTVGMKPDDAKRLDAAIDLTVAITAGWRGLDVEFSEEKARELYTDSPAIRAQVDKFFLVRRNFMKG